MKSTLISNIIFTFKNTSFTLLRPFIKVPQYQHLNVFFKQSRQRLLFQLKLQRWLVG